MPLAAVAWMLLAAPVSVALAQRGWLTGDSLLALGRINEAESAYYAAVRANPRDPASRLQLGVFLASRGAVRVGTVLMEEARTFGGDSATIARILVPWYARLGDHKAMVGTRPSPLNAAELERLTYLLNNPTRIGLRDTAVVLRYRASPRGPGFGTVLIRIGRAELAAAIDPEVTGVVLPATVRAAVTMFGDSTGAVAVATFAVGGQLFEHVSATVAPGGDAARVGFDVLAPFSPSFDPRAGTLTLHRPDRRWRPLPGTRVPALYDQRGVRLLLSGGWTPTSSANVERLLASRAWTWDARRGDVVLLTP